MRRLILIIIIIVSGVMAYAPGVAHDPQRIFESWLHQIPLTKEHLKFALEFNKILAPEIVIGQCRLETGDFRSFLCRECHNLFGMKYAPGRATTAIGAIKSGYAIYPTWYDSVKDMGHFQEWYRIRNRDMTDYFQFLANIGYAEDPEYLYKVWKLCIT
jgi:flagellum-specific peptidoglycan hydrolase FlgJ